MNLYFVIGVPVIFIGVFGLMFSVFAGNGKLCALFVAVLLGSMAFPYFDITRSPSAHDKCDLRVNGMWIGAHQQTIVNGVDVWLPHGVCAEKVAP